MEKKMGVYICTGCGLGDALEIGALAKVATGEYKAPVCREHPFFAVRRALSPDQGRSGGRGSNHRDRRLFASGDDRCL